MPTHDDDDDDRDSTPRGLTRRLKRVEEILGRANTRLDAISSVFTEPPTPDKPTVIAALNAIKAQAAHATKVADELIARTRG